MLERYLQNRIFPPLHTSSIIHTLQSKVLNRILLSQKYRINPPHLLELLFGRFDSRRISYSAMGLLNLFAQPFMTLQLPPPNSFASQTVIITGANTGLGLETARHIVSLGASKAILGIRTLSKGLPAKADIEATTGRLGVVEVWEIDLDSFSSVKAFAARAKSLERIDTAIMNAGLANAKWRVSPEGWEQRASGQCFIYVFVEFVAFAFARSNWEDVPGVEATFGVVVK